MHQPRPDSDEPRRRELAAFVRGKREATAPAKAGLPDVGRRRTPGLRREELAGLVGVSTTWVTWIEQARDVQVSDRTLQALARTLDLSPQEADYLRRLARRGAAREVPPEPELDPALRRYVDALPFPAYVTGRFFELLAANDAARELFGFPPPDSGAVNFLAFYFTDERHRARAVGWDHHARLLLSKFRAVHARHLANPTAEALLADMLASSREFAAWWAEGDVNWVGLGEKRYRRAGGGEDAYDFFVFQPDTLADVRVAQLVPKIG